MKDSNSKITALFVSIFCLLALSSGASFKVSTQSEWNNGTFNGTSADRDDNSGTLGLGYLNGSASGQPNHDSLNNGSLVGYWRMDASSDPLPGSFDVKDYSGQGLHGNLKNNEGDERGAQGVFSTNSFDFDSDDMVDISHSGQLSGMDNLTVSFWTNYDGTGEGAPIGGERLYEIVADGSGSHCDAGTMWWAVDNGDGDWTVNCAGVSFPTNWTHWALVSDKADDEIRIYKNGEKVVTNQGTGTIASNTNDFGIGNRGDESGLKFDGEVDEVRIYNQSLSSNLIQELYLKGENGNFSGTYEGEKINNSEVTVWNKININLTNLPSQTSVDANFTVLDSEGSMVDSQLMEVSQGSNNYSLSVSSSKNARLIFNGTSKNANESWEISSYNVYYDAGVRADYLHTYSKGSDKPRSFFANNSAITIRSDGQFSTNPAITIRDSDEDILVNSQSMTNFSGIFEYNFTINQSRGWYDVEIGGNNWENVFYQSEEWQGNFTDADGNKYTFRREINVSEPGIDDRWFEPVVVNVDFGFSPDNDSIRVVAWNGSRMLEVPSQIYNVTKSGDKVSNANIVFLSTMNQTENRTYYVVSSKSEYSKNYTGLNNTDNALDEKVENSRFEAFFNQSLGYLMRDVKDKLGSSESLSGIEPMDQYPQVSEKDGFTSEDLEARSDITAEINVTEGPLRTELSVEGDLDGVTDYPYSVDCEIYFANPYMICEKNLTVTKSAEWKNLFFNGLAVGDGKMGWSSYRNSNGRIMTKKLSEGDNSDYSDIDNEMNWISFYDNSTGDALAEIFLQRNFSVENNPEIKLKDTGTGEIYQEKLIDGTYQDVSEEDYWYSKTARMIYNGLREYEYVNKTYRKLRNPLVVSRGQEATDDHAVPNYSETGNISTNDSSSVKIQSYWQDDTFLDYAEINITGNGVNGSNTRLYYNTSYNIQDTGDFTNDSWVNVTLSNSTVNAGEISANITVFDVAGKSNSTQIDFNVSDATAPEYSSVINEPNSSAELDPDQKVNVTANITEYSNVSTAFLYYKNESVSNYSKVKMERISETDFVHTYEANFTPAFEENYTYYVSTNDTIDQRRNSSRTNFTVAWDYTWNFDTSLSGETATFNKNVSIGNFTINNTGDFNQTFRLSTGVFNSRTWVNGTRLPAKFEISNGTTEFFTVNATTRDSTSTEGLDTFNLTVENSSASPDTNFTSFDVTTSTGGPFLFTEIADYNSTVTQGDTGLKLTSETTNKGNESANTVNITFELPKSWTVSGDRRLKSPNTLALAVGTTKTFTTEVDIPDDASTGTKNVKAVAKSQETNRSTSVQVSVQQKSSNNNQQQSSSSGGGGGGSSGDEDTGLSEQQRIFQTQETYEIVRGEDQNFTLTVENPFKEGGLENVKVNASGFLSQYLSVQPNEIDEIAVNKSENFSINIEAPRYFSRGEYRLNSNITGINNRSETRSDGNQTFLVRDTQDFKENREVELIVHEISKEKASRAVNASEDSIKKLKNRGVVNTETRELLAEARDALKSGNYQKAQQISQQIQNKRQKAENADQTLQEVRALIEEAEHRGLKAPRTSRMVSMSSAALERGDYSMAASRAEEAKTLYAIETKGEINYLNYTKRNWEKISLGLILLIGFSTGGYLRLRLFRIKRELSKLDQEEETLLGLMKQVQRESFEEGKMSMEEYEEAMMQYEKQLSQNVKNTVRLESRKAHWKNIRKGRERYEHERDRIQSLMQETQKKYLEKGQIETRVYKQKMQSFRERLTELEGKLAEIEAQKQINRETSLIGGLKNAIPV